MYQKAKYQQNPEIKLAYQKYRYQKKSEIKIDYQKVRYQENSQMQKNFQRKRYKENPEIKIEYQTKDTKKNAEIDKKNQKQRFQENKKKLTMFAVSNKTCLQQIKQGPYYIFKICHRSQYQPSVRLCEHEKYNILIPELYHLVKPFNEKLYACETCHKDLTKNQMPSQAVCNKWQ